MFNKSNLYRLKSPILISLRAASNTSSKSVSLTAPRLEEFPKFLKDTESRWKLKLQRRHEREQYSAHKAVGKLPRYILSMFPYPSGRLHLGHVKIYTSGDILTRYSKLVSKNPNYQADFEHVVNPMGFDSFGLPAENAAKERGLNPAVWTNSNIRTMKQQLDDLAMQFDWREATSNPSFYKWTQAIFLRLMEAGLVYKSFAEVNWDPVDKTVLADEQVDGEGRSWRSGALVERRHLRQWFIKVNAFTKDIYNAEQVEPESWQDILSIQRNWIGEPSGWIFYLPIRNVDTRSEDVIPVFTRNPELFIDNKVSLTISSSHWLEKVYHISKKGYIDNPFTGDKLGVLLTSNVEDLPCSTNATLTTSRNTDLSGENMEISRNKVVLLANLNGLGGYFTSDKYRDWLISRQRFWGTPIPVVNCENCGYVGVSDDSLPVTLPLIDRVSHQSDDEDSERDDVVSRLRSPIERMASEDWLLTSCPNCHSSSRRECETFDTLFDSSWYFLRYASTPLSDKPFDQNKVQPVWCYIGGKEHASMHLFYARFITHFLYSQGLLEFKEPFKNLMVQGVVKSRTYKLGGRYLTNTEVESIEDKSALVMDYEKMSKSKMNGVDPQELLNIYGIDATRLCLMSYANPKSERLWRSSEEEFKDVLIFLRRVVLTVQQYLEAGQTLQGDGYPYKIEELDEVHLDLRKTTLIETRNKYSIEAMYNIQETNQLRQYITAIHSLLNTIRANLNNSVVYTKEFSEALASIIVMLNPITPHLSEELWAHFSKCFINPLRNDSKTLYKTDLQASDQPWPISDEDYPLHIKVKSTTSTELVERIPISKAELRIATETDIAKIVESAFATRGDSCSIREVRKFTDLMAIVVANIASVNEKKANERKRKKELKKQSSPIKEC